MKFRGKTEGKDVDGIARRLGDRDSMGHIVGFIDDEGNCWESVGERDRTTASGRYMDAMIAWEKTGGTKPIPTLVALECCFDPENISAAVKEARESWQLVVRFRETKPADG